MPVASDVQQLVKFLMHQFFDQSFDQLFDQFLVYLFGRAYDRVLKWVLDQSFNQPQQSTSTAEFIDQSNGSDQTSHKTENGSGITSSNDVASATIVSTAMFSANGLVSAMAILISNFIAADPPSSINAPSVKKMKVYSDALCDKINN